jgi:polysaccharide transporter, PST family
MKKQRKMGKGKKMVQQQMKTGSFVKGAAILSLAALCSKILGVVYRIPYQNMTGNEGMYVYQQVYPLYSTLLILATAGFPIAISKLVAEKVAAGDAGGAKRVFQVSSLFLLGTGCLFFLLLYFGAEQIAVWMGNRSLLTLPIRAVSFALIVVPTVSALRGYFQGYQNMVPTAISQVVEQLLRVITILLLSWYFMKFGFGFVYAGAGAVFAACTGAMAALLVLLFFGWRERGSFVHVPVSAVQVESSVQIGLRMIRLSLPICLGSLILPLYALVDSFTVTNLLLENDWKMQAAIVAKGIYDRGQPLLHFTTFFATAISLSIVPAIAEVKMRQNEHETAERAYLALRLTWFFGLPASVGLAVIAVPVNVMLFRDADGSDALAILAFTTIFSTLGVVATGILQGAGMVVLPALNSLAGVGVKLLLNQLLIPLIDIRGAALATVAAYGVATLLNLFALGSMIPYVRERKGTVRKSVLAVGWMAVVTLLVLISLQGIASDVLPYRLSMTVTSMAAVLVGMTVYLWANLHFGILTRTDLEKIPRLKQKVLPMLDKWGLLRS